MTRHLKLIDRPTTPEDDLQLLFRREAELVRELAEVRQGIGQARLAYMMKHRTYGVRVERLRSEMSK